MGFVKTPHGALNLKLEWCWHAMARSRRKYKQSRPKVRVGLPKKKRGVFKLPFGIPEKLLSLDTSSSTADEVEKKVWDSKGTYLRNYRTFGVVANPNILSVRARTPAIVQSVELQIPNRDAPPVSEFDPIDSGSDVESDDLKAVLGKQRRDGKSKPILSLTTIQRVHIGRLIQKYGDDYEAMFMDTKLNSMQHSVGTLKKLCQRYSAVEKTYVS
ncbi:hypothetical protein HPP92_013241 [Vanilla planifolia]|uniref:Nucleolar protein 16 n=1 Tax=Vanilla planifolia TaxID=51239 RepID=A0A835QVE8_VANPL|nr:hypothetical protein HPP92_013720 [Vanilla planifolia]KAG0478522.1 hypothetical protein HPP92_013241 [Vanilla planifolia]